MSSQPAVPRRLVRPLTVWVALAVIGIAAAGVYFARQERAGLPPAGSAAHEECTRRFFRGLAKLEVGLMSDAVAELTRATELAPGEPAVWANLGLAHASLGEFDAAAPAIERATALAPASGDLMFLRARVASLSGDRETAIAVLRRAVESEPAHLQAWTALVREVEDAGSPGDDDEAQRLLERLVALQPDNPAVLVERARLAAKRGDEPRLADSLRRLDRFAADWPPAVVEQLRAAEAARGAGELPAATRAIAFLRNLLVLDPRYREGRRLVSPPEQLIAEPISRFLRLPSPAAKPAPADEALALTLEPIGELPTPRGSVLVAVSLDGEQRPAVFVGGAEQLGRVDAPGAALGLAGAAPPTAAVALDWNHDFRMDLAVGGAAGVRLFLQSSDGSFSEESSRASARSGPLALDVTGLWAADVEMDGDLDLVVGVRGGATTVLRNNGDGTWQPTTPFGAGAGVRELVWGDLDDDGDPDAALLDGGGTLHLLANLQAGRFAPLPGKAPPAFSGGLAALAAGDVDADGVLDLVMLGDGVVRRASLTATGWSESTLARWPEGESADAAPGAARLLLADLDNNGALDLVATSAERSSIWLAGEDLVFRPLAAPFEAGARAVVDLDGDGRLDLVGLADGRAVRSVARGTLDYHFHVVRPRAQSVSGDQRINSFAIGGTVEARTGRWVQRQAIRGPAVHFGLGRSTAVDVTRVVWPNGVPQAEFDPAIDRAVVAEQRLKGSCPWVFAFDGDGLRFVTDFLWRSPLGLRINAHDTAGATQTEDWVKIRGDQLAARDGVYDVRISAELWETHFVDHVALLVVDRPEDVEVFVDERFVPVAPPALAVHATRPPRPFVSARDQRGNDVTEIVARRDGRFVDTFELGRYQGIAEDHHVELELDSEIAPSAGVPDWLVAHGWIYPTDSSINVAIGQGGSVAPKSLALDAQGADGRWVTVAEGLGFPAGKSKTILLDLGLVPRAGVVGARRLRLRTNLEIYWDALARAAGVPDADLEIRRRSPAVAELRFRGYSATAFSRRLPEMPDYARLAGTAPRWRDLTGFYTRFGDVRTLLAEVEDRYVIMNAGDELRLSFEAPPPPARGRARDFVLVGDGWVKDGDFNTTYSRTVHPLPEHGRPDYETPTASPTLEEDPVYRRHRADWEMFHTRYVEPRRFVDGLELAGAELRP